MFATEARRLSPSGCLHGGPWLLAPAPEKREGQHARCPFWRARWAPLFLRVSSPGQDTALLCTDGVFRWWGRLTLVAFRLEVEDGIAREVSLCPQDGHGAAADRMCLVLGMWPGTSHCWQGHTTGLRPARDLRVQTAKVSSCPPCWPLRASPSSHLGPHPGEESALLTWVQAAGLVWGAISAGSQELPFPYRETLVPTALEI